QALPYAQAAAESYAAWALTEYANVLTALKQYDDAAKVLEARTERYDNVGALYRWMRASGHGDAKKAAALYREQLARRQAQSLPNPLSDVALFHYLEGDVDTAIAEWQRCVNDEPEPFHALLLGVALLEQKHSDEARKTLGDPSRFHIASEKDRIYSA